MRIAIACNRKQGGTGYLTAEYDSANTVSAVADALAGLGHTVSVVDADAEAWRFFLSRKGDLDMVFNIAEGIPGESRESQIPALLDMLGVPYTGPGVRTTAVCLDKGVTKKILQANRIPTAPWVLYPEEARGIAHLRFPVVLKPVHEGSSIGITGGRSRAQNPAEALKKAHGLLRTFSQPILVEEFLPGAEITAGLFGNRTLEMLPLLEIYTEMYPSRCLGMATAAAKTVYESDAFSGPPRRLSEQQVRRIRELALRVYRILGLRDFGRIDFRLDGDGEPNVMEVNPIPGINPRVEEVSYFTKICRMAGMTYPEMIERIVGEALERIRFH